MFHTIKSGCSINGWTFFKSLKNSHSKSCLLSHLVFFLFRCSAEDAGEYKVIAKSSLGEATSCARLIVNCELMFIRLFRCCLTSRSTKLQFNGLVLKTNASYFSKLITSIRLPLLADNTSLLVQSLVLYKVHSDVWSFSELLKSYWLHLRKVCVATANLFLSFILPFAAHVGAEAKLKHSWTPSKCLCSS